MRTAKAYFRSDRGVWVLRIYEGKKRIRQQTLGPPSDPDVERRALALAERFNERQKRRAKLSRLDLTQPLSWDDVFADYLATYVPQLSKGTRLTVANRVAHLKALLGDEDVRDFSQHDLQRLAKRLRNRHTRTCTCTVCRPDDDEPGDSVLLGHESVIGILTTFRRAANLYARGLWPDDPLREFGALSGQLRRAAAVDPDREEDDPRDAWEREEVETLLELARQTEPNFFPLLLAAFHTGARRGELIAVRICDVNLDPREIHFRRQVTAGEEKAMKWRGDRGRVGKVVPMSRDLAEVVAERVRVSGGEKVLTLARARSPYLFPATQGGRWHEGNLTRTWLRLRRRAATKGVRPFPFHATRHTFISWALEAGENPVRVAKWAGAQPEVILREYGHVLERRDDDGHDLSFLSRDRARPAASRRRRSRRSPQAHGPR